MEPQKTQNCQSNPEKQKPSRRHNPPRLLALLQSHSHQNSVVLVSKQSDRAWGYQIQLRIDLQGDPAE